MLLLCCGQEALAQKTVSVKGYYRKDGTYVRPHTRSAPGAGPGTAYAPAYPTAAAPSLPAYVPTAPRVEPRTTARTEPRADYAASAAPDPAAEAPRLLGEWVKVTRTESIVNPPHLPAAFGRLAFGGGNVVADGGRSWSYTVDEATRPARMEFTDDAGRVVARSLWRFKGADLQLAVGGVHDYPRDIAIGSGNALVVLTMTRPR